jgi:hypothetical protein
VVGQQAPVGELALERDRLVHEGLLAGGRAGDDVLPAVVGQGIEQVEPSFEETANLGPRVVG